MIITPAVHTLATWGADAMIVIKRNSKPPITSQALKYVENNK